jgi:hypothetical protein
LAVITHIAVRVPTADSKAENMLEAVPAIGVDNWEENTHQVVLVRPADNTEGTTLRVAVALSVARMDSRKEWLLAKSSSCKTQTVCEQRECRVVYVKKERTGPTKVAVEFTRPAPSFWRIAHPPNDWNPST